MCSAIRLCEIAYNNGRELRPTHNNQSKENSCLGAEKILLPQLILLLTERFEIALHTIQPVYAVLELFGQAAEGWSQMTVLEVIEGTDNPIRLLARFHRSQ
jgi:hypothetical protein